MTGGAITAVPRDASARTVSLTVERLLPLITGAVIFAVGTLAIDGQPLGALRDDSMYVVLAKSLATGNGYRWLNLPGAPAAIHFPPGYPALLALIWWLAPAFPANVLLFKLANSILAAIAAVGVARFVTSRFELSEWSAHVFVLAAFLAAPMLSFWAQVMSEPLFLALLVFTLLRAESAIDSQRANWREAIVLAVLAGAMTLVRTSGVALLPAIGLALCLRRRFRDALVFVSTAVVLLLPWQLWVMAHANALPAPMRGNYESYTALLGDAIHAQGIGFLGAVALRTSHDLAVMFRYLVAPGLAAPLDVVALLALIALAALGVPTAWRRATATTAFLAAYAVIVLLWPYTPGRFVWCIWPFVFLLPVQGVRVLAAWAPARRSMRLTRVTALAAAACIACGFVMYNVSGYRGAVWTTAAYGNHIRPLLVQVASHTRRDALLATESEGTVYLYTGRTTVPLGSFRATDYLAPRPGEETVAAIEAILDLYHPEAVVVSTPFLRAAVSEMALVQPPLLAAVDTFPGGGIVLVPTRR